MSLTVGAFAILSALPPLGWVAAWAVEHIGPEDRTAEADETRP